MEDKNVYDLAIIGAGPAGLSASIYASRFGIKHIVFGSILGGTIVGSHKMDNYPGVENVSGIDFSKRLIEHAQKYGVEMLPVMVRRVSRKEEGDLFEINSDESRKILAKTILLAVGAKRKKLEIKGENEFLGKGVSYCATCDGPFYKNKKVAVIGGSHSAVGAATYLADLAEKVYLIYRKDTLRAEPHEVEMIKQNKKITILYNLNVKEIVGEKKVEKIKLDGSAYGKNELEVDGVFIEIGSDPSIDLVRDLKIETDETGYIKVQRDASTSAPGVWAAGDITDGSNKFFQVVTAAAEGAIAARSIYAYLGSLKKAGE
jgi:thioredoxin reductase (NADPH)